MSFYRQPPALLSQGTSSAIPWGLIEAPTTIVETDRQNQARRKIRILALNLGDAGVMRPWARVRIIHAVGWSGLSLVLWHGCEIRKSENQYRQTGEVIRGHRASENHDCPGAEDGDTTRLLQSVICSEHHAWLSPTVALSVSCPPVTSTPIHLVGSSGDPARMVSLSISWQFVVTSLHVLHDSSSTPSACLTAGRRRLIRNVRGH